MKKTLFTAALALLGFGAATAQTQVGLRAGFNLATATNSIDEDDLDKPWRPGLVLGLATSFRAGEMFAIAPEVNYVQKGAKFEGKFANLPTLDNGFDKEYNVKLSYVEVPILFRAHFGDVLGGYLNAGPSFGYLISGEFDKDGEDDNFEVEDASFNRFEIGGAIGGGLALNTEIGTFLIDLRYTRAFTSLYDGNQDDRTNESPAFWSLYDGEAKNQMISTSLIYLIPSLRN